MSVGKLIRKGLSFANVVANSTATAQITPGRTLEGFYLLMGGTFTSAHVTLLRMKVNGKAVIEATGAQLDKIAKFSGMNYPTTVLPVMFTEMTGRDFVDQMAGAFDTSKGIDSITVEVTIGAATSPTLECYLIESPPQAGAFSKLMHKVLRYPYSVSSGGQLPISLPFGPNNGAIIKRIHVEHGVANNVTALTLKENAVVVHESTKAINDAHNQFFRSVNQTNTYSVDMMPDENVRNCMDTRSDRSLELLVTFAAADTGMVIVEYLDQLGNL